MKTDVERPLTDGELCAIRNLITELDHASCRDDLLGRLITRQLRQLPIPLLMWSEGHPLR